MKKIVTIAVVDDHRLFVQSIELLLSSVFPGVRIQSFYDGQSFITAVNGGYMPDITLLDIQLGNLNGPDVLTRLNPSAFSKMKIIVISSLGNVTLIQKMIQAGAKGYLDKTCSKEELKEAIETVLGEENYIANNLKKGILQSIFADKKQPGSLSKREMEVLNYLCNGYTVKEIASEVALSPSTIQLYIKNLFRKLNVNRTADLIVYGMKNALFTPIIK